jgi:hypothetical protein
LDIDPWGWHDDDWRVVIRLPIWSPVGPEGHDEAGADEDTRPSRPMMPSVPMAFIPMPPVLMAPVVMAPVPVPTTVGVSGHGADHEQHSDQDEDACPLLPCPHGFHRSLGAQTLLLPTIVATCFQALPGRIHGCADAERGGVAARGGCSPHLPVRGFPPGSLPSCVHVTADGQARLSQRS